MLLPVDDFVRYSSTVAGIGSEVNEAETESRMIFPLLEMLGWKSSGLAVVQRQVRVRNLFADVNLIYDGRPLCVIEVKRPSVILFESGRDPHAALLTSLTKEGRAALEQALTYAVADGVPFAWVTNGRQHLVFRVQEDYVRIESRLIFVATSPDDLIRSIADLERLTPEELDRLRLTPVVKPTDADKPASAIDAAYERLTSICGNAANQQLQWMVDVGTSDRPTRPVLKYSPSTFVRRSEYEAAFSDFWSSAQPLLMFLGEAGTGKTSLLCHLVLTMQNRTGEVPCLFRDAFTMGNGLVPSLRDALSPFSSDENRMLEAALDAVENYVLSQNPFPHVLGDAERARSLHEMLLNVSGARAMFLIRSLLKWAAGSADPGFRERFTTLGDCEHPAEWVYDRLGVSVHDQTAGVPARFEGRYSGSDKKTRREQYEELWRPFWKWASDQFGENAAHTFDVLALIDAFTSSGDSMRKGESFEAVARRLWVKPLADLLCNASPSGLLAADENERRAFIHLLSSTNVRKFVVIIDAINESPNPALLRSELADVATRMNGRLGKLIVSCRTPDLRFFKTSAIDALRFAPAASATSLDVFELSEFRRAWSLYAEAYDIRGVPGPALTDLCRNPLILRLMCEGFAGSVVPEDDVRLIEIFDSYWSRKVENAPDGLARAVVLQQLADIARQAPQAEEELTRVVPLSECRRLLESGIHVLDELVSEAVVVFLSPTEGGQAGVRFMYESFHEYVIARNIREREFGSEKPEAVIRRLIHDPAHDRLLRGALTYLVLWLDRQMIDTEPLIREIFNAGYYGEAVTITPKLRRTQTATAIVHWLARQALSRTQREVVARSLARHVRIVFAGPFGEALADALQDPRRCEPATASALSAIDPRHESLHADTCAFVLGFSRLWQAAYSGSQLDPSEEAMLSGSKRAQRLFAIAGVLLGKAPCEEVFRDGALAIASQKSRILTAVFDEISGTARDLLTRTVSPEAEARKGLEAVTHWIARLRDGDPFLARVMRGKSVSWVPRRRFNVLDVLIDEPAIDFRIDGTYAAARLLWPLFRALQLSAKVRIPSDEVISPSQPKVIAILILSLYEVVSILNDEQDAFAVAWLDDLRRSIGRTEIEEPLQAVYAARDLERIVSRVERLLIRVAGTLTLNTGSRRRKA